MFKRVPTFAVATAVVFFSFDVVLSSVNDCGAYTSKMDQNLYKNYRLTSHIIESSNNNFSPVECYVKCLKNCLCVSFNFCNTGKKCELNSERKDNDVASYKQTDGCDYYEYDYTKQVSSGRCLDTCCSTSQICLNGGKCEANCLESGKRFKCSCPDGFRGNRCEKEPRSCAPYVYSSNHTDGLRLIYAPDNKTYLVFCRFSIVNSTLRSDTLVMSYARSNSETYKLKSLTKHFPRSQNKHNWLNYRLSLEKMKGLRDESIDWAFTCAYDTRGFKYNDYLRVKFEKCDILKYIAGKDGNAINVEYVNIRGSYCHQCTIGCGQGYYIFHTVKDYIRNGWKDYPSKRCTSLARYFGAYKCHDTSFACMASSDATTQLWFTSYGEP